MYRKHIEGRGPLPYSVHNVQLFLEISRAVEVVSICKMAGKLPCDMRAVALSNYCKPTEYDVATLPVPEITKPDELLIRVYAASINPIDVKMASG